MKIGMRVLGVGEERFEGRIAELVARLQQLGRGAKPSDGTMSQEEVSDGKRELGAAAGDLRRPDR